MGSKGKASGKARPATALALHIGLNSVDAGHYAGWSGDLTACEFDARDMAEIAKTRRMPSKLLLTRQATRARVLGEIRKAAKKLGNGDLFFLSYSGHGGQVPDVTGEEGDKQDETWCLYDGQLIDDELYLELGRFKRGVRILVLSDSCHSGTVVRAAPPLVGQPGGRSKLMPLSVAEKTYRAHKVLYDRLQRATAKTAAGGKRVDPDEALGHVAGSPRLQELAAKFNPALILISGCQDNQTSLDGDQNGAFTGALLEVWSGGAFAGTYHRLHQDIVSRMPHSQTPNLFVLGSAARFLTEQPWSVQSQAGQRVTVETASHYLGTVALPRRRRPLGVAEDVPQPVTASVFDTGKTQAAVVGSSVISFVSGVTPERREAIVNSSLLAQLLASKKVPDASRIYAWYDSYFEVLSNIGWVVQDRGFAEYTESSKNFAAHKAILAVATTLLGAAPAALAVVKSTIEALQSMGEGSPWITIFNREAQHARAARFQVGLAEQDANGQFFVNLMAFGLEAKASITQVLFFKSKKSEARLRHYSGRVTINTTVLDSIRPAISAKLVGHSGDWVEKLPDL